MADAPFAAVCSRCEEPIYVGSEIIQVARGRFVGNITPTYSDLIVANYHPSCYPKADRLESPPYYCNKCIREVTVGEEIFYTARGTAPSQGHIRPESRGYGLVLVMHSDCRRAPPRRERRAKRKTA